LSGEFLGHCRHFISRQSGECTSERRSRA
jgi:hypothetical protein